MDTEIILRDEIIDEINSRPLLCAEIATSLGHSLEYTIRLVRKKDRRLTQASIVQKIRSHIGNLPDEKLFTKRKVEIV